MRKFFKFISSIVLIPITRWYLKKERKYSYRGISVIVKPGVFHPGLFYSTKFILEFLQQQSIANKTFLELGSGSGLISTIAAKAGARVTASDISTKAVENTALNANQNKVSVQVVKSDIFDQLQTTIFDWIVINPPYYAKRPSTEAELAWHCGEHFEYFEKLFTQLPNHIHNNSEVIMVLTKGCDLEKISEIAGKNGFQFKLIRQKKVLFDEMDFLFRIVKV